GSHPEATEAVFAAMSHPSAGVRRNAVAVAATIESATPKIIASGVLADNDPHVRLAALLAIADQPSSEAAAQAVMQAMADPFNLQDRWLRDAMTSAAASSALPLLKQTAASAARSPLAPEALAIIQRVAEHWARSDSAAQVNELLAAMATGNPRTNAVILDGLQAGWPRDGEVKLSAESEDRLVALLESLPGPAQSQLVSLANRWGSKKLEEYGAKLAETLVETIQDEEAAEKARIEAARQLISFLPRNEDAVADILESISPRTSPLLAQGLIEAVGRSEAAEAGNLIVESLGSMTPSVRPIALQVLLGRADGTAALLDGVEDGLIRFTELSLDQKQRLASHPDAKIAARSKEMLASGGGLPNADRQKVLDELMPLVERQGDVAAGKVVFTKQCAKCHTYKGEGAKVGPDLTGMAIHPKKELLTHIIDPSRSVEGNFRVYTVVTDDGRVTSGLLASETRTTVEMFDAEGKRHVLQRDEIEELIASPKSLMPEGFEKQATPDDLVNLLEFLTQRGRFVPIPLDKVATIVSTKGMFHSRESTVERMVFADWSPKTVGEVPFMLVDPDGDRRPNVVLLHGPQGSLPPQMPRAVTLPCNTAAKAIHLLSGVSGWGHPLGSEGSVSLIVRLHYADGETEDHALKNGVHFADYIRRVDVPESKFAFDLDGRQIRYLSVQPER
ncbi:MAG: c-type cytochrome, partial [Planctomycetales bacterium]|nr:c-type cytochrome [Planctomycetales bacterium]